MRQRLLLKNASKYICEWCFLFFSVVFDEHFFNQKATKIFSLPQKYIAQYVQR